MSIPHNSYLLFILTMTKAHQFSKHICKSHLICTAVSNHYFLIDHNMIKVADECDTINISTQYRTTSQ